MAAPVGDRPDCSDDHLFDARAVNAAAEGDHGLFAFVDGDKRFRLRPLRASDYETGYMDLLSQLTVTGNVTHTMYSNTFNAMKSTPGTYYIVVIENTLTNRIVASGSLILEKKFIHSCGQRGRIEDIVVDSAYRGKQFGKIVVKRLIVLSRILNCYKISLECNDNNVSWYSSMGFVREQGNSNFMQIRLEKS